MTTDTPSPTSNPTSNLPPQRSYAYYDLVMAACVCVLLCSNFIGAAKQAVIDVPLLGPIPFSAGILFFPISYIFGDILTEVYGFARSRKGKAVTLEIARQHCELCYFLISAFLPAMFSGL